MALCVNDCGEVFNIGVYQVAFGVDGFCFGKSNAERR